MMITRTKIVTGACIVALLGSGVGAWALLGSDMLDANASTSADSRANASTTTAKVVKGDLTEVKRMIGALGYDKPVEIPAAAAGTITWLPKAGDVIKRDGHVYRVDERAVHAMHGSVPLYRELAYDAKGADVRQLNENLAALGYDVAVDDTFGKRTLAGVKRWQKDRRREVTGTLGVNDIVFVDGDVRVATVNAKLGSTAVDSVLEVTGTKRVVTASVPNADTARLTVGTKVGLEVLGAGSFEGVVSDAQPAEEGPGGSSATDLVVSFDSAGKQLPESGGVRIEARGSTSKDVLSVPVAAVIAGKTASEYAVEVPSANGETKRVPVTVGLVADGRAAIEGDLAPGDDVVVPR
jgi:hypothetical protein